MNHNEWNEQPPEWKITKYIPVLTIKNVKVTFDRWFYQDALGQVWYPIDEANAIGETCCRRLAELATRDPSG